MLLVDTTVWSLALRRDAPEPGVLVDRLSLALHEGDVATTGLVAQELLQGFHGPTQAPVVLDIIRSAAWLIPTLDDHVEAAAIRNRCRRQGVQVTTVDALLAALSIRRGIELLTADQDFTHIARLTDLRVWRPLG